MPYHTRFATASMDWNTRGPVPIATGSYVPHHPLCRCMPLKCPLAAVHRSSNFGKVIIYPGVSGVAVDVQASIPAAVSGHHPGAAAAHTALQCSGTFVAGPASPRY